MASQHNARPCGEAPYASSWAQRQAQTQTAAQSDLHHFGCERGGRVRRHCCKPGSRLLARLGRQKGPVGWFQGRQQHAFAKVAGTSTRRMKLPTMGEAAPCASKAPRGLFRSKALGLGAIIQTVNLGLPAATRLAPAAYWTAWANALPIMRAKLPSLAEHCVEVLDSSDLVCLGHAAPPPGATCGTAIKDAQLGDWLHGWQLHALRTRNS